MHELYSLWILRWWPPSVRRMCHLTLSRPKIWFWENWYSSVSSLWWYSGSSSSWKSRCSMIRCHLLWGGRVDQKSDFERIASKIFWCVSLAHLFVFICWKPTYIPLVPHPPAWSLLLDWAWTIFRFLVLVDTHRKPRPFFVRPEGSGVQTKLKVAGDLSVQPSTLALHSLGFIAHLQTRICHPH